uniref:Coat protein n=1 Tax=Plasmopara viticola lesion associated Partiti-like 1 TaxID=2689983 RepID=A0A6B9KAM2_9VIRU|nr:coat protein [Plasmopara viticola lesion associated Partiti-like 1]
MADANIPPMTTEEKELIFKARKNNSKPKGKRPPKGKVKVVAPEGSGLPDTPPLAEEIPISGWGTSFSMAQRPIDTPRPRFTVSANPFLDLVDQEWLHLRTVFSKETKDLPRSVFRYYNMILWWRRVLELKTQNSYFINVDEQMFLHRVGDLNDLQVSSHIAQYLKAMGNFSLSTDKFFFDALSISREMNAEGYFVDETNGDVRVNQFWLYYDLPCMRIFRDAICVELDRTRSRRSNASEPLPTVWDGFTPPNSHRVPTTNILGYGGSVVGDINRVPFPSNSAISAVSSLGWNYTNGVTVIPSDCNSVFWLSPSTMKFVSDIIEKSQKLKSYSIDKVFKSNDGNAVQAAFLKFDIPEGLSDYLGRYSFLQQQMLQSREKQADTMLVPGFDFGFRTNVGLVFDHRDVNGNPVYHQRSSAQPWKFVDDVTNPTVYFDPAGNALQNINEVYSFGESAILHAARKTTASWRRADVLPVTVTE